MTDKSACVEWLNDFVRCWYVGTQNPSPMFSLTSVTTRAKESVIPKPSLVSYTNNVNLKLIIVMEIPNN